MTEHILYIQNKGLLQSNEEVQIIGPFFSVTGKGLRANV
ncbi:LPS export ABC transporter periplasmic protein LptC, partial [Thermodesulfobacteriota bacterium]